MPLAYAVSTCSRLDAGGRFWIIALDDAKNGLLFRSAFSAALIQLGDRSRPKGHWYGVTYNYYAKFTHILRLTSRQGIVVERKRGITRSKR